MGMPIRHPINKTGIATVEGLKKIEMALPPSMACTKKSERHAAWGCQFQLFEHPRRDTHAEFEPPPPPSIGKQSTREQEELEYVRATADLGGLALVEFWGVGMFIHKE